MSLIFKALKKLKDQPVGVVNQDQPPKKERYVYSFRKIILSPLLVGTLVLLLVVLGLGLFFAVDNMQPQPAKPNVAAKNQPRQIAKDSGPEEQTADGTYIAKEISPGSDPDDIPPAPDAFDAGEKNGNAPPQTLTSIDQAAPPVKAGFMHAGEKGDQNPQTASRFLPKEPSSQGVAAQTSLERQVIQEDQPWPESSGFPEEQRVATEAVSERTVKTRVDDPEAKPVASAAATRFKPSPSTGDTRSRAVAKAGQGQGHQKILRQKMTQQARIARLVARIQANMNSPEDEETKMLIDELEALKGSENAYVLKLKAYWHLRHDDFEAAALLLNKVLQNDAEDLEAGINMAVTEMKTNQLQAAQQRLAKLREVYPDNTLIPELLSMLR